MSMAAYRPHSKAHRRIVLMGVAGCGKSSVGAALATRLGAAYLDGDDLHSPESIAKMSRGEPLTDGDRWPWLALIGRKIASPDGVLIIGCSALKRRYRDRIRDETKETVTFVYLSGTKELIVSRMSARSGHFMPAYLIDSQFAALEPPSGEESIIIVDIGQSLESLVDDIMAKLG